MVESIFLFNKQSNKRLSKKGLIRAHFLQANEKFVYLLFNFNSLALKLIRLI